MDCSDEDASRSSDVALLELDKLSLAFGGLQALSELDLSVDEG